MLYPHWTKGLENEWIYDSAAGSLNSRYRSVRFVKESWTPVL